MQDIETLLSYHSITCLHCGVIEFSLKTASLLAYYGTDARTDGSFSVNPQTMSSTCSIQQAIGISASTGSYPRWMCTCSWRKVNEEKIPQVRAFNSRR